MNEQMYSSFEESIEEAENLMFFGVIWNTEHPCLETQYV